MGTINIKGKPYHYTDVELTYENAVIINPETARKNLLTFKRIMDEANVEFLLMHGTLLGAIREHDFIKHDIDIDVSIQDEYRFLELIPAIEKEGLKLCRYYENVMCSLIRDGVYIDVYFVNILPKWCVLRPFLVRYLHRILPRKFFVRPQTINFLGETYRIPNHHLELIEHWYGKDWRTPVSNAPSDSEYKKLTYLEKHFRFLFRPFYKWIK